jgi:hypothetical protein
MGDRQGVGIGANEDQIIWPGGDPGARVRDLEARLAHAEKERDQAREAFRSLRKDFDTIARMREGEQKRARAAERRVERLEELLGLADVQLGCWERGEATGEVSRSLRARVRRALAVDGEEK